MKLLFISDPLFNDYGQARVVLLLSRELSKEFNVSIAAPMMSDSVHRILESWGVEPIDLSMHSYFRQSSTLWLEMCLRQTFLSTISTKLMQKVELEEYKLIGFTCIFGLQEFFISYGLGTISSPLSAMKNMPFHYRIAVNMLRPLISYLDKRFVIEPSKSSQTFIATSRYCANLYRDLGVRVHDVIYPPLDCEIFKPADIEPRNDYVLSYVGKETDFSVIRMLSSSGVRTKLFGTKLPYIPADLRRSPNIEFLGQISTHELVDLYSNAYYTLFPFTDEFFGYVPVESMACGTPVLTYGYQGPGETVLNNKTGWLARNSQEMVKIAIRLKHERYPSHMRQECRRHSLQFDVKYAAEKWTRHIQG